MQVILVSIHVPRATAVRHKNVDQTCEFQQMMTGLCPSCADIIAVWKELTDAGETLRKHVARVVARFVRPVSQHLGRVVALPHVIPGATSTLRAAGPKIRAEGTLLDRI